MLHSWGSAMTHHPHVHMVVPGGGLSPDGSKWIACRPRYFLPVEVLSALFRRLFLQMLVAAHDHLQFFGDHVRLTDKAAFDAYLKPLRKIDWVVYAKEPFAGPKSVALFVALYPPRRHLQSPAAVRRRERRHLQVQGLSDRGAGPLQDDDAGDRRAIRRFLIHVLPKGFHRIRHYRLLASGNRVATIARARELLAAPSRRNSPRRPRPQRPTSRACCRDHVLVAVAA